MTFADVIRTNRDLACKAAGESGRVAYPAFACVEACEALTELISLAMSGEPKCDVLSTLSHVKFVAVMAALATFKCTHPAPVEQFSPYRDVDVLISKSNQP